LIGGSLLKTGISLKSEISPSSVTLSSLLPSTSPLFGILEKIEMVAPRNITTLKIIIH